MITIHIWVCVLIITIQLYFLEKKWSMKWERDSNVDLYCNNYKELYSHINRHLNDPEQSKDLLQDLYFKLQKAPQLKDLENPIAYLKKMAYHLVLDYYRQGHIVLKTGQEEYLSRLHCTRKQPESGLVHEDLLKKILQKLDHLAEEKKDILLLHKVSGWNYLKIAKHKKRSLSWVEKSMSQVLALCNKVKDAQ